MSNTLFVTLLCPKGKGADAARQLKSLKEKGSVKIHEVLFTFGRYDGVIIFEAASEKDAMEFIMETGFSTQYMLETLVAVSAKEL